MKIGILDWGIGGIDFAQRLRAHAPGVAVFYLSDNGSMPYGKLSRVALSRRVAGAVSFLKDQGAAQVVIACNAASTVLPDLEDQDVIGVIEPTLRLIKMYHARYGKRLGVVGGKRTIASGAYAKPLRAAGLTVVQRVAQPLSAFVESGELETPRVKREVLRIMAPLAKTDALVLACTHYLALGGLFAACYEKPIIDPAAAVLETVLTTLKPRARKGPALPMKTFTTGNVSAMKGSAYLAFGARIDEIKRLADLPL